MADPVLMVQRTECGDYRTLVARLPRGELTAVCAAVIRSMLESGVDIDDAAKLARDAELLSGPAEIPIPLVLAGGRG